ncbi:hypothetical protein [Methanoregula sp.]|jgi:precorrin-6B methylase 2|uniref:hypothetical protein n=1 Tax=Methanoregula sp. TaxID=2052170 RepID=UPI0025FFB64A|nr:hypothetical protein [Methanoregula sp.]
MLCQVHETSPREHRQPDPYRIYSGEALDFPASAPVSGSAFMGGSRQIETILPILSGKVRRVIVANAVLVSTRATVPAAMQG